MKNLALLIVSLLVFDITAQNTDWKPYVFPERNPFFTQFSPKNQQAEFLKLDQLIGEETISQKNRQKIIEELYYYKKELFVNGEIYFNYKELENYLNGLLQKIIPDGYKNSNSLHVYIGRNYDANAYCLFDGTIIFNIGLLAKMETEGQIAQVLAHEFAHYVHKDVLKNYSVFKKADKKNVIKKYLNIAHYSRIFEAKADSLSFELVQKAGYDIRDCYNTFDLFTRSEAYYKKTNEEDLELAVDDTIVSIIKHLRSHPEAELRENAAKNFAAKYAGVNFSQKNDSVLLALCKGAKYEELHLQLENGNYSGCALMAFNYYLNDQKDSLCIYFLLESLRRELIIHPSLLNAPFLESSLPFLSSAKQTIFSNPEYLGVKPNSTEHTWLLDHKAELRSYKSAILFFSERSESFKYPELWLCKALLFYNDPVKRTAYLNNYNSLGNTRYPNLALDLSSNTINWFAGGKYNIYLCSEMYFLKGSKLEYDPYSIEYTDMRKTYLSTLEFDMRSRDKEGKFLFKDTVLFADINTKKILFELFNEMDYIHKYYKSKSLAVDNDVEEIVFDKTAVKAGKKENTEAIYTSPNLYFLLPHAYELFRAKQYNSVTYLSLISFGQQFKITADRLSNDNSFKQEYWDYSRISPNKLSGIINKIVVLNIKKK